MEHFHPGATYINTRRETPLTVKDVLDKPGITLAFDRLDYNGLSRMYQMIHLQRELALPFADVDLLLTSILRAQGQTTNWHFTPCTLRALGVFRYLNEAYGVSAEQFAALVLEVSPYSVRERLPMLDRVLDGLGAGQGDKVETTLVLDDREFNPADGGDGQYKILPALCKAVGLDEQVTLAYLDQVKKALGLSKLALSLNLLSSLYRLSRLHRLLDRPLHEGIALVALLGTSGATLWTQLAGKPVVNDFTAPDVLDLLVALVNLDQWLREEQILPSALLGALTAAPNLSLSLYDRLANAIEELFTTVSHALEGGASTTDTSPEDRLADLAATLLVKVFGNGKSGASLTRLHIPALLRWCGASETVLLNDILKVTEGKTPDELDSALWLRLEHRCKLIECLRLSPGVLQAMSDNPKWFDLAMEPTGTFTPVGFVPVTFTITTPIANLDFCYQLSRFRAWIEVCKRNGADESMALLYLSSHPYSTQDTEVTHAVEQLAMLIGWSADQVRHATPHIEKSTYSSLSSPTFDDFISSLPPAEKVECDEMGITMLFRITINRYIGHHSYSVYNQAIIDKLVAFVQDNPGPLLMTRQQYDEAHKPGIWADVRVKEESDPSADHFPITLEALPDVVGTQRHSEWIPCVPTTITDIDHILRLKALCTKTGLPCQSLQSLSALDQYSAYTEYEATSQLLLESCEDALRDSIEKAMQERWRNALAGYLLAHWAPSYPSLKTAITTFDDLSDYFLTDIGVSSQVSTTLLNQAISSLQNYHFRLHSQLEPGFAEGPPSKESTAFWHEYLSQYDTWKQRQDRLNHPANLIYYANRPNQSVAFQELRVELNKGQLDSTALDTPIRNFLSKYERMANLQIVSGYLDGHDPQHDTYHLIGKTNTSPAEYYWRTLDMGLRDDKERLSPLAWSEWEKVDVSVGGKIAQFTREKITYHAIRPVVIAGRRYVFWVERGTTDVPSGVESNKTLPNQRKLTVQYTFQQSDSSWSAANQLICLDGHNDEGAWIGDTENPYLKDANFQAGLIVTVDNEGEREDDPWVMVMLHDYSKLPTGTKDYEEIALDKDYFIEARDLQLIENKLIDPSKRQRLANTLIRKYRYTNQVQYKFNHLERHLKKTNFTYNNFATTHQDKKQHLYYNLSAQLSNAATNEITIEVERNAEQVVDIAPDALFTILIRAKNSNATSILKSLTTDINKQDKHTVTYQAPSFGEYVISIRLLNKESNQFYFEYKYTYFLLDMSDSFPSSFQEKTNHAQFLQLDHPKGRSLKLNYSFARVNTLFSKKLVSSTHQSLKSVLAWQKQCLREPNIDNSKDIPQIDFHGAHGLFFRELFLHLPALVAARLTEQHQFDEARQWYLNYLFNPYQHSADESGRPVPWRTRPLAEGGTLSSTLQKDVDPVSRVFILSTYYKEAVFLSFLDNWRLEGDHAYRQLTLSSLNHAWVCYQQASKLLGPLPKVGISRWKPVALADVKDSDFRRPLNPRVVELHQLLESRIYNLRHGLTLDGKALPPLDWGSESLDAFTTGQGGVSMLPTPYTPGRTPLPLYRFRQLMPLAKAAAQQLLDFGRHYMKLMEDEFNTSLDVQLTAQEIKISEFAIKIQRESISGVQAKKQGLLISRDAAEAKKKYLSKLIDVGRSQKEEDATALTWVANSHLIAQVIGNLAAGTMGTLAPHIVGMAIGFKPDGILTALAKNAGSLSKIAEMASAELKTQAEYDRRAAGWEFDRSQTEWDIKLLNQQIKETNIELNAATLGLQQCEQALTNLEDAYVSKTTGFTIIPVYNWLVARQEQIYGAAYDAVLSICLSVEEAWRYEIGDYKRASFIETSAWRDNYKGMLVGESLLLNLQQMENEYLAKNERRLTVKKSFSLRKHLDKAANTEEEKWSNIFKKDTTRSTPLNQSFAFKADDFDRSYPGQYLRQLKYVSLTFVLGAGKKVDELCAILKQNNSSTLLVPDKDAARSFYPGDKNTIEQQAKNNPTRVLHNLYEHRQIALSSTEAEDGLGYEPGTWVYELMFHDGRYLPFEGTGAISEWTLELLGDEELLKDLSVIEDIKFNMVYTAKAGNADFIKDIGELRSPVGTNNNPQSTGVESPQ